MRFSCTCTLNHTGGHTPLPVGIQICTNTRIHTYTAQNQRRERRTTCQGWLCRIHRSVPTCQEDCGGHQHRQSGCSSALCLLLNLLWYEFMSLCVHADCYKYMSRIVHCPKASISTPLVSTRSSNEHMCSSVYIYVVVFCTLATVFYI